MKSLAIVFVYYGDYALLHFEACYSTLSDQRLGISLNVDDAKGTVSSITFTPPEQRRPAENQK